MKCRKCVNSGMKRQSAFLHSGSPGGCTHTGSLSSSGRAVTFRQTPLCTGPQVAPGYSPVSVCLGPARGLKMARWGKVGGPWGCRGTESSGAGPRPVRCRAEQFVGGRKRRRCCRASVALEGPFQAGMALLPSVVLGSSLCPLVHPSPFGPLRFPVGSWGMQPVGSSLTP